MSIPINPADAQGVSRLVIDAILGVTNIVDSLHHTIVQTPGAVERPAMGRTRGITGMVYGSVRGITRTVGIGIDLALRPLVALLSAPTSTPERDTVLAALNGVLGDYLAATANPLAIPMQLYSAERPLDLTPHDLAAGLARPSGRIVLLIHGLCMTNAHWSRQGHDHGARLAEDLGYTPLYLRYNTGLHVSTNGRALAQLIEQLVQCWPVPVEEIAILAHSMGGLVARSAYHYGAQSATTWVDVLRAMVFLGTPHHGAPLEKAGSWVDLLLGKSPYTAAFARLGQLRSAGITDLRYGNLLDEDWMTHARSSVEDQRLTLALPSGVACYAIGATVGTCTGDLRDLLLGDGLVPLSSALGQHTDPSRALSFPPERRWVGHGMHHFELLSRVDVYQQLHGWLAG